MKHWFVIFPRDAL